MMTDDYPPSVQRIIFLDIETVPLTRSFSELPENLKELWIEAEKTRRKKEPERENLPDYGFEEAGLRAEFGKIICISVGRYDKGTEEGNFTTFSVSGDDEVEILTRFSQILAKYPHHLLCAHNGKNFDYPFLARRFVINGVPLPSALQIAGKKPWNIPLLDTRELWAFGGRDDGGRGSLALLCGVFGIPTPKDDISGKDVRRVYYEEHDLARIERYCEKDIRALALVYQKIRGG